MIDYGQFQFASLPRTATTWFMRACYISNLGDKQHTEVHVPPNEQQSFLLTIVRHPYTWLNSYYREIRGGFINHPEVDELVPIVRDSVVFEDFLRKYVNRKPGHIWKMIKAYRASTVIRMEDLPWSAVDFFITLDVNPVLRKEVVQLEPMNKRGPFLYDDIERKRKKRLRKLVCDAEPDLCNYFDYDEWEI